MTLGSAKSISSYKKYRDLFSNQIEELMSKLINTTNCTLNEAEELDDFFEFAPIGMLWVGQDGTILKANKFKLSLLGYNEDEFVGHNIAEFHPDLDNLNTAIEKLSKGEVLHKYPVGLRCKDGSVKRLLLDSNGRFKDGQFIHTRCITREENHLEHATAI